MTKKSALFLFQHLTVWVVLLRDGLFGACLKTLAVRTIVSIARIVRNICSQKTPEQRLKIAVRMSGIRDF